ncbi:HNH endonuclease [Tabrizicola soli]|uniref:HNH endonuclease n=1 Tax=Tabrizicola soli TaxID=2185115 RepID=A0ABV7DYH7_9RHOB|nr:HNH endonuclease [Tabrizicola soli]
MRRAEVLAKARELAALYSTNRARASRHLKNSTDFIAAEGPFPFVPLHRVITGLHRKDMLADNLPRQELARHHPRLTEASYVALRDGASGFEEAWQAYLGSLAALGVSDPSKGTPSSRAVRVFYVPTAAEPRHEAVLLAMDQVSRHGLPEGFGAAKVWFVQHPDTGEFLPAKAVWGQATGLRASDFNAHHARDKLRALDFHVPGPDDPAADLALSPQELVARTVFTEGAVHQITTNSRERSPEARREAEAYWRNLRGGLICEGCEIDFGRTYGLRGEGFMHFHHRNPLAAAEGVREVDGARDLVPLCPNCHAMVHRGEALLEIEELRALLGKPPRHG